MGIRMSGLASGIDPQMVDKLVELQKIPVESAKKRKEKIVEEKKEFEKLNTAVSDLDKAANGLKNRADFFKLKVESSHPDIIDGIVGGAAVLPGSYEFEVRGMARTDKELAFGFPDRDKTSVGFGYMQISRENDSPIDIIVEPGSTLENVADKINDANAGLRAMIVNTGYQPDSFRLLVLSEKSGKESQISIDPDTTFLDFNEQVKGQNLDVLFEDVPITSSKNQLDDLIDGVTFNVKRAEPGTRIQVSVTHDIDTTVTGIKDFVDKYNVIATFVNEQSRVDPQTRRAGMLGGDSSVRQVMRQLQSSLQNMGLGAGKYRTLADVGITTNSKTGALDMDETKVRAALTEDYEGVAKLFTQSTDAAGVAAKMADAIRGVRDPGSGALRSRMRGLDSVIQSQDRDIERRERQLGQREEQIRRRFTSLEGQMANLQQQGQFLAARFGGGGGEGGGPAGASGGGG